ncbi:MAG: CRISPR-associated protein [Puniceicoccaceae bacterium 5H]|nr:MAG: CRISPR-associated protein [Puniceicoccaceae bacterium 5H]
MVSCRKGQLVCESEQGRKSIPLEDVAAIIITSFSTSLHSHLLIEAAKQGVALVICEHFQPVSLLLPANRSSDTLLTKATLALPEKRKGSLWRRTINAKCVNQYLVALELAPYHAKLERLRATAYGKSPHKESAAARYYWQIYGEALGEKGFERNEGGHRLNGLLNYGYAVLLTSVLQKLFAVGLDPTFGIYHATRERSTPLAYDLMEPFRPCVDWRVWQWMRQQEDPEDFTLTKEFKRFVTGFVLEKVGYLEMEVDIRSCIEGVVRSFRRAVLEQRATHYQPWTPKNSKWAG